jgi:flavin-binding protein dodecin
MDLTLDQLLASFETGMNKSASDDSDKKYEKEYKGGFPFAKKDEDKSDKSDKEDKDEDKDEKDEDKSDKEDESEGQEKEASLAGAALAREVMEKVASLNLNKEMNKQASTAGQALARALLKKASAGDMTTMDGIAPGIVPNKNQVDNAQMEAEGASYIKPMLTGNGIENQGNVNQIFDAMIQDALSQGAASTDQVHERGVANVEGAVEDHALPNQIRVASEEDEIEKAAAVAHLVANGINFDDAFEMVKQAEVEISFELEKVACLGSLMEDGFDYETAVELVKQASADDLTAADGIAPGIVPNKNQVDNAQMEAEGASYIKPMPTGNGIENQGNVNQIFDAIVQDAISQGAASTDQVHERGVANVEGAVEDHALPNQVKVAAMNSLLEAGIDFDKASDIVKQAGAIAIPTFLDKVRGHAMNAATDAKHLVGAGTSRFPMAPDSTNMLRHLKRDSAMGLATNPVVQGTAAAGVAAGVGGYALSNEKKAAAMNELMDAGIDFDEASEIVKQASASTIFLAGPGKLSRTARAQGALLGSKARLKDLVSDASSMVNKVKSSVKGAAGRAKTDVKLLVSGETGNHVVTVNSKGRASSPRLGAAGRLASNGFVQGVAAGVAAAGAGGYALSREKKAAVDLLTHAGVDFDSAVSMVNEKAAELYGE